MNFHKRSWRRKVKSHNLVYVFVKFSYIFQGLNSQLTFRTDSQFIISPLCTCYFYIMVYTLAALSEKPVFLSSSFTGFSVSSNRETRRTRLTVPFSPACSFLLLPPTVFRLISLCLYLSFFLSFSLLPSSELNILRTFEAAAKGTKSKVPTALRAFLCRKFFRYSRHQYRITSPHHSF